MYNNIHIDVLKEIINIGIGKGAEVLNTMVQSHIKLEVPEVKIINQDEYSLFFDYIVDDNYSIITLQFDGELNGYSKLVMTSDHAANLVDAFIGKHGANIEMDSLRMDILSELGNVIINAVMGTVSNVLELDLTYVVPTFETGSKEIIIPEEMISNASAILFAKTNFKIEAFEVTGNIVIFFKLQSLKTLIDKISNYYSSNLS